LKTFGDYQPTPANQENCW